MSTLMNKQTITLEWDDGNDKHIEIMLNTWFLGVYVQNKLSVAHGLDEAVKQANHYQREYEIEDRLTHHVREHSSS